MVLTKLLKEYIEENKFMFYSYIVVCCIGYFIRVIITSLIYSQFFENEVNKDDFFKIIKNICIVWIVLSVLYIIQIRLEYKVIPDFLAYIRKKIFRNYIVRNETNFNDSNITDDVNNILEMTRNLRDLVLWGCQTLIPTIFIMIVINLYFLFKYPSVGVVNIIGNIINYFITMSSYKDLIEVANLRMEKYIVMANKLDESFNNLFNAYINDKIDDMIKDNNDIEDEYFESFLEQMKDLEMFSSKIRVNNYLFAFITLYMLYKNYSKKDFINALLIYTFYLSGIENMADDIPFIVINVGNIIRSSKKLLEKNNNDIVELSVKPTYSKHLENFQGNIRFENVYFKYNFKNHSKLDDEENEDGGGDVNSTPSPDLEKYVLQNFTLDIPSKSKVSIFARSGSGKTTLMKLLLAFYSPEKGRILLDNDDIQEVDPVDIRKKINYINQRTMLIKGSIMDNIKYGNNKSNEEIIEILNKYNLLKIFNPPLNNPESCLQNMVEKNGINISLGMQKVIFLVRGTLKDGADVFVYDEPLTSIDAQTRSNVLNMIKDKTLDKTLIIITHDKEVLKIAPTKILFDDINQKNN